MNNREIQLGIIYNPFSDEMYCAQKDEDCQDIRRCGAVSLDLAYVACGRIDGYMENHLKLWDYAAGALIVREAGGESIS